MTEPMDGRVTGVTGNCDADSDCGDHLLSVNLFGNRYIGHVRTKVGRGVMTIQYNIRYGFFRNLIAGVVWAIIGSIGCSILYFFENNWKAMSLFIAYTFIFMALFLFKKIILEKLAFSYADTLFNEYSTNS